MEKLFTTSTAENTTNGALELMAKLAVLIVAALLFAGYGIRDGRTQTMADPGLEAPSYARPDRLAALRRLAPERNHTAARAPRAAPTPLINRF